MKKVITILLTALLFISCCTACSTAEPKEGKVGRLIINGNEIETDHVLIYKKDQYADIPILTVLRELEYDVKLIYIEDTNSYQAVIDDNYVVFDTAKNTSDAGFDVPSGYGVPYCAHKYKTGNICRRELVDNDIIISSCCFYTQLYHTFEAEIWIDYRNSVVYVNDRTEEPESWNVWP